MAVLLKLSLVLSLLPLSSPSFNPTTSYFLACGSPAAIAGDDPHHSFLPDSAFLTSASASASDTVSDPTRPAASLYSAARVFTAAAYYRFSIPSPASHVVRLHFFPITAQNHNLSAAQFNVSAQNRILLLSNFTPTSKPPIIKEYLLWIDGDKLIISFSPKSIAFINAIEVFTAPANLIGDSSPRAVGGAQFGAQFDHQALETIYRLNVGGPKITSANDTLWRDWAVDDDYFISESLSFENSTSGRIVYQKDERRTPEIAPEIVYSTARTMAVTPTMVAGNPDFNWNLTWSFRVPAEFAYFIRMHFCDFISQTANELYFDVYIGGILAYQDLQPAAFTDSTLLAAFFVDFTVEPATSGLVNVSVGRSRKSFPSTVNAIVNGLEIMKINNSLGNLDFGSFTPNSDGKDDGDSAAVLIPSILGGGLVLIIMLIAALLFLHRKRQRKSQQETTSTGKPKSGSTSWGPVTADAVNSSLSSGLTTPLNGSPMVNLGLHIPFLEIKSATNDFDESFVIGSGGFGKVYKGVLRDGTRVAVKRGMPGSKQGYPEFQTEITLLSRIRHRHLVSLIGYSDEHSEMLLVYEYMEKGPLKNYLYGGGPELPCLPWNRRLEICIAAARGLHYLHTGHSDNIIHRDVKSSNILLDENYLAKVSDFGLSKLGPGYGETHVSTRVKGSFGYLDPEYFKTQKLTDKSDVYSFGVTLFEVLCARPVIDQSLSREQLNLAEWAAYWQRKGKLEKIVDPRIAGNINPNSLRKFGETAEKCLAEYSVDRPSIGDVLWNLEYALQLQETELRREPHEDSGAVETEFRLPVERLDFMVVDDEEARDQQLELSTSKVFSQLITDDGR